MTIRKLIVVAGLDEDKARLQQKINRSISQLGLPTSRKNQPRQLSPFDKKKRAKLLTIYYKAESSKDADTLKALEAELQQVMKPLKH
jgi:hypothetical protein